MPPVTHLHSSNPVDLEALRMMGVSVKTSANPIGQFGTGFKYALAVLLRNGHRVTMSTQDPITAAPLSIRFTTVPRTIRGQDFSEVTMQVGDAPALPLSFTTEFGRHWEMWQAYRELRSNAMDEAPWEQTFDNEPLLRGPYPTTLSVVGAEFYDVARKRDAVFLDSHPVAITAIGTVTLIRSPTAPALYYRGIKVATPLKRPALAYNITAGQVLTEDRTLRFQGYYDHAVCETIALLADSDLIAAALAGEWEHKLAPFYEITNLSDAFVSYVQGKKLDTTIPAWARQAVEHKLGQEAVPDTVVLSPYDQQRLAAAKALASLMSPQFDPTHPVQIARSLGPEVYGMVKKDKIYISYAAFDMGREFLAATLVEEFAHASLSFRDESRAFQNWLLQALASAAARLDYQGAAPTAPAKEERAFGAPLEDLAARVDRSLHIPPIDEIPF